MVDEDREFTEKAILDAFQKYQREDQIAQAVRQDLDK